MAKEQVIIKVVDTGSDVEITLNGDLSTRLAATVGILKGILQGLSMEHSEALLNSTRDMVLRRLRDDVEEVEKEGQE